jgi:uncharacterized repeat protein (TIGR02543 family)
MKKRILSLVLCAAMLLSMCLFLGAGVTNSLTICDSSGEAVKRVDLPVNQKISLTAQAQSAAEDDAYQWQIRAAKNVWANILGSDTQTLELSYPMVASALSEKNTVQIRCRLTSAETGEATFSDAVTVEVTAATAVDTPASADAAAAPVLRSPAKVAAAANDAYGTYTIIINYVFTNGRTAAQSWTATVAKDSDYSATIASPAVVGYKPDQDTVAIDVKNIQADKTFTVTYSPALVDFTVEYYQQNVNDDKYTSAGTQVFHGYTEDPVSKYATGTSGFAVNYDGFTRLLYEDTATIAADGSTVVELYYDRNYYLMNFDLDGGYGVEPIYARYGAPISVGTPTKPGYTFDGSWTPALPDTMPVNGGTYTAKWTAGNAKYVVQYWQENANDDGYSYVEKADKTGTVGTTVSGSNDKSYQGFTYNNEKTDKNVTIKGDGSTVVNVYYDRNVYTVTFPKGELTCGKEEHKHSHDQCCTKTGIHIHGYSGLGTCNADKCPVGYAHTHSSSCYSDLVIEAKYGAFIGDKWPGGGWYVDRSENTAQSYLAVMPLGGKTFYGRQTGDYTSTATYYVEVLPGESGTVVSGKTYKQHHVDSANHGWQGLGVTDEERYDLEGFTCNVSISAKNGDDYDGAKFYYTRNSYELVYNDQYGKEVTERLPYEQTLSESVNHKNNYEPAYPSGSLEAGAYTFGGWYTDPGCTHPVDWTAKMPAAKVVLYAKWAPVTHKVTTWLTDAQETPVNVGDTGSNEQTVNHRGLATKPVTPINGGYTFVGWFYKDANGTEHAFDFSMPVTKDLNLYAKWSSNTLMEYTIHYKLRNGDTTIAQDTKGSALAGSTKTFEAKTGDQLNDGYRSGYFPETSSHSITMDIEGTAENGKNDFTFYYVQKDKVKYTVRYLEKGTNTVLHPEKTGETPAAVITEKFEQIKGYAPDAYQKRLVLSANDKENVLVFWYTEDTVHAPVQIVHEIQNIEGDGYTEYQSSTNLNGVIGEKYDGTPLTIPGFSYNESASTASGKLTAAGLVLTLKYDRIKYPYEFRFLEQGTDTELWGPVTDYARYQAQVTETAKTIPGYELVSGANSQSMVIQIEDPDNVASKNVKTFYYREQTVDIKYVAVGSGTLDTYQETQLKVLTGKANGSTPTPNAGYKFVGWYTDEACTQPVKEDWVTTDTNKLTPQQSVPYGNQKGYGAATYYAKFERDVFDLTITKAGKNIDPNQTFVFHVKGNNNDVNMQVVITGTNKQVIKNLPVGDYTITEDTSWSWKYTPTSKDQSVTENDIKDGAATVTFENKNNGTNWLTSLAKAINTWAGGKAQEKTN